jgi:hypothetical protein
MRTTSKGSCDSGLFRPVWDLSHDETGYHDQAVCVPNWSSTLCDLGVFMYQPVEQIATSQVKLGWCRRWW